LLKSIAFVLTMATPILAVPVWTEPSESAAVVVVRDPTVAVVRDPTVVAVGDIARRISPSSSQRATARLAASLDPDAVIVLGDAQYDVGAYADFMSSYDPTWGRLFSRTRPVPGNHEYLTAHAAGFFRYFDARIPGSSGHYSYNLGSWHLIALNSFNGLTPPAAELAWLKADLAADNHRCQLAYWHHPRWSSGGAAAPLMDAFWRLLYRHGVDVVLNGHDHLYERFAPLRPSGRLAADGIRQFTVGTGGHGLFAFGPRMHGSQARVRAFGVLRLVLHDASYRWSFRKITGSVPDAGTARC
jgi:acid phosphatase type 7